RVIYPDGYYMSTQTEPVDGIDGVSFRYLVKDYEVIYTVEGSAPDSSSQIPMTESYEPRVTVSVAPDLTVADETDSAWVFKGWTTSHTEIIAGEFIMPFEDVVVIGTWEQIQPGFTVTFLGNGGTVRPEHAERVVVPPENTVGANMPPNPSRNAYTFAGWNTQADGSGTPFTSATEIVADITVYAQWSGNSGGGGSGPGPGPDPGPDPDDPWRQAFLIGTPDGLIRPNGSITRAEVATIFFRLIEDEVRAEYWTQENLFSDVQLQQWFNNAVSTATNMGLFEGIGDQMFAPNRPITRGELAVILVRFMERDQIGPYAAATDGDQFNDIADYWGREAINQAALAGWVEGPEGLGGPFHPERSVTRAETAAMINRIFRRLVESSDDLLPDMIVWPDNPAARQGEASSWYYLYMQSATNSYTYAWKEGGAFKKWLSMIEPRDWSVLEKPDSRPEHIFRY
ncbi:MAG: S-layer homology domain-containing protein, partial [Oscillospiraceae bacterium]|nr:S-layer homology domain-containing protein [Oscillospiraceae bacterium]